MMNNEQKWMSLQGRVTRLKRLLDLEAPEIILAQEKGMVMQAIGRILEVPDPDNLTFPSYGEVALRWEAARQEAEGEEE
jgi:hypothetical protein